MEKHLYPVNPNKYSKVFDDYYDMLKFIKSENPTFITWENHDQSSHYILNLQEGREVKIHYRFVPFEFRRNFYKIYIYRSTRYEWDKIEIYTFEPPENPDEYERLHKKAFIVARIEDKNKIRFIV